MMRYAAVLLATLISAPAFAAPRALELAQTQQAEAIAVAHSCITNETEHEVMFESNWGIGDRWARIRLAPGEQGIYRLVLDAPLDTVSLTLRFPFGPASDTENEVQLPTVWGDVRSNDCTMLPNYDLIEEAVDGEGSIFVLRTPAAAGVN